jgi:hypothetical protein
MIIRLLDLLKGALLLGAAEKGIRAKTVQIQRGILLDGNKKKCEWIIISARQRTFIEPNPFLTIVKFKKWRKEVLFINIARGKQEIASNCISH